MIDITKPPYNADPTGQKDCTDAIQRAINDCSYIPFPQVISAEVISGVRYFVGPPRGSYAHKRRRIGLKYPKRGKQR